MNLATSKQPRFRLVAYGEPIYYGDGCYSIPRYPLPMTYLTFEGARAGNARNRDYDEHVAIIDIRTGREVYSDPDAPKPVFEAPVYDDDIPF